MYKVLVVDDEPIGLNHVCMILKKKCPQFMVIGSAENGKQALDIIKQEKPDIVITDIKMPIMDGITLVSEIKNNFPEILAVIVSGHSEFEYARAALKAGVCDYLLKPLVPSDMKKLMDYLEKKLNVLYYEKRNKILRCLCNGKEITDQNVIKQYFPEEYYYAAVVRQNGLPGRVSKKNGTEIFSMEEERIYIYGRDEMEALYLVPGELLLNRSFEEFSERIFEKELAQKKGSYVTAVIYEHQFTLEELPEIVKKLYRKLEEAVIIGKSYRSILTEQKECKNIIGDDRTELEYIEYLIHYKVQFTRDYTG